MNSDHARMHIGRQPTWSPNFHGASAQRGQPHYIGIQRRLGCMTERATVQNQVRPTLNLDLVTIRFQNLMQ